MRIKTVKLDDLTRNLILRSAIAGNRLTLPEQLDRADYLRVAKAIEAAGGKWSKKDRCHIFPADVKECMGLTTETVEIVDQQQTFQAFNTPPHIANLVAEQAELFSGAALLEPSAGTGNLLKAAIERGVFKSDIVAVEINPKHKLAGLAGTVVCADFLQCKDLGKFDRVIMNPPFSRGDDIKHIRHALGMLATGGRLVSIVAASSRPPDVFVDMTDWIQLPKDSFAAEGTRVNTAIVIFDK